VTSPGGCGAARESDETIPIRGRRFNDWRGGIDPDKSRDREYESEYEQEYEYE
jgi:hypothetical protein